ncbi:hypothetical protein VI08_09180 [Luteibacter yeojuensis]|uniref:EAL domain-containing protein n=1 Tax=Luteibacter yeojuensis TaxID=345309 RepID=A0A0F3KU11_9GAMM|nr:hypothetical protein VI08_09180 [Luteibacter yeojuensis]
MTNLAAASQFLSELKARGIRIALDDVGAGVASFGYLKSLAVDYLKIDGQLVVGLSTKPIDMVSVKSFCKVVGVLGLQTVAEYAEDEAALRLLDSLNVDMVQGYHLRMPEPLARVLSEAKTRRRCLATLRFQERLKGSSAG